MELDRDFERHTFSKYGKEVYDYNDSRVDSHAVRPGLERNVESDHHSDFVESGVCQDGGFMSFWVGISVSGGEGGLITDRGFHSVVEGKGAVRDEEEEWYVHWKTSP